MRTTMTITTRTHTKDIATTAIATTKAPEHTVKNILSLSRMMQFGDSMLPVGAFAFSNGLESAVQKGVVHDAETLRQYTHTALEQAAKGDAVAVVSATRAALAGDLEELIRVDREVLCRKLNEETRLMATRMGRKLAEMGADITENPLVIGWRDAIKDGRAPGTIRSPSPCSSWQWASPRRRSSTPERSTKSSPSTSTASP